MKTQLQSLIQRNGILRGKNSLLIFVFLLLTQVSRGQLLTEQFNYTPSGTNGIGFLSGSAWNKLNSGDSIFVVSGNLSYTGLTASVGNSIAFGDGGTDYYRAFTSQTSGTIYCSFLLNVTSLGTLNATGSYPIGFIQDGSTTTFGSTVWLRSSGANYNIGINPRTTAANTSWLPATLTVGTTYLVVFSYEVVASTTNDIVRIWLNPTSLGGAAPTADATVTNTGTDLTSVARVLLRQSSTTETPDSLTIDEMRIGTTWAQVTPVPAVAPVINSSLSSTGNVAAAYSYFITATNTPTSYSSTALPAGLSLNSSTGEISGTPTTAGPYSVDITATNGAGSDTKTLSITIGLGNQTITFGALPNKFDNDAPFALTATASSGLPVSYISSNPLVASVAGNIVTPLVAGTTTFTASQPGNANYNPATDVLQVQTILASTLTPQTITFNPLANSTYGDAPFALTATASSGLPVTYMSSNPLIASISGSTVTILSVGTVTITASQSGNGTFSPAPDVIQSLTIDPKPITVTGVTAVNRAYNGSSTVALDASLAVFNTIINPDVVTASGNGTMLDPDAGLAKPVTAALILGGADALKYVLTQPSGITVDISQASQSITFNALPAKTIGDAPFALTATASSGLAVSYLSSDPLIASISGNIVTINAVGTVTITASQTGDINYTAATPVVQSLTINAIPIAAWDFFGQTSPATFGATTFNANLNATGALDSITRGSGANSSSASNSFRTAGFQNNGIATTNTDYFQITLTPNLGYTLSLSSIDARFAGTGTFAASPGVSSQFAYSTNGTTFTLIGSPSITIGTPATLPTIDVSSITALQNIPSGTTVTLRYYASGQTTTGGWGFNSPAAGQNGLAIGGTLTAIPAVVTMTDITQPTADILQGTSNAVLSGFVLTPNTSVDFTAVTVNGAGTATSTDLSNVRIFRDNDGNGAINGADASVSGAGIAYGGSMIFTIGGETGITSARNYLVVADVAGIGVSTPLNTVTASVAGGGYTTTAPTNNGSATGALRTIVAPVTQFTISGTVAAFNGVVGTPTFTKQYLVSGVNLLSDIVITPPAPFEISLDSIAWVANPASINLTPTSGTVSNTIIYVRYNPVAVGTQSGVITHTTTGAAQQDVSVSGTAFPGAGPLSYPTTGVTVYQEFNGLPSTGTINVTGAGPFYTDASPVNSFGVTGWQYGRQTGGSLPDAKFTVDNGSGTSGSAYSYGGTGSTERALGTLLSSSVFPNIGVVIVNNTTDILNRVKVSFVGEQWRNGGSGIPNSLVFEYSLNGTNISTGTYTAVPQLNFVSPVSGVTAGALNGNLQANRTSKTYTFTLNGNWAPGQLLVLRWNDPNDPSSDDGLAIDSFAFMASPPVAPITQDNTITFSSVSTTSLTINWLNGDGSNRIVAINTANTFTNPVDANTYTANNVYSGSGEQIVYNGSGSSVNITGLTPGTTYHARVFGYNGTGVSTLYNINTATQNPNFETTVAPILATQLAVTSVNGNAGFVIVNQPFSVVVQSQDGFGNPQPVAVNTTVMLSVGVGLGSIASGTISGVILAGTSSVTITGVVYDIEESSVQLQADATAGDVLTPGLSASFDAAAGATSLLFATVPAGGIVNTPVSNIVVNALKASLAVDPNYSGAVSLSVASGPGTISGTTTVNAINGIATFNTIQFSTPGTYTITATSGSLAQTTSLNIIITNVPVLTELVVPKHIGSRSAASTTNDTRTPIAVCLQIDNLLPNTTYNMSMGMAVATEANTSMGAGTIWNDTAFTSFSNYQAFSTDANGNTGPFWVFFQPTGNNTVTGRFEAGVPQNLRIAYSTGALVNTPNFVTTKTITPLDIPTTARTPATTDDGAFLKGTAAACASGKFMLIYDNESGTGDPLYSFQVRQTTATGTNNGDIPSAIANVYSQTGSSVAGDYVGVIPIGANNPNGVRRIELRNSNNTIWNAITDADGVWPGGANTTTIARRGIATLTAADGNMNTMTSLTATSTNLTCFGSNDGTATAAGTSSASAVTYSWLPGGASTAIVNGLAAGTYTVTGTDVNGCALSASTTVSQPTEIIISGVTTNATCTSAIGAIDITVTGGAGGFTYSWSNLSNSEDLTGLAGGTYTVIVTDVTNCSKSASFFVASINVTNPLIVSASPTSVCAGGSSILTANGAVTYTWSPAAGLSGTTGSIVTATIATATTYTVTGIDGTGCQSTGTVSIGINSTPVVNASGPTTICTGNSVILSTSAVGSYLWSPNNETTSSITVNAAGAYSVTVDYGGGCVRTSSVTNVIVNSFSFTGTLYSENMGVPAGTTVVNSYTGWQNGSPITYQSTTATQSDVRTTSSSSGYTGASAGGNVFFTTTAARNLIISGINTLGSSGLSLTFGLRRDAGSAADPMIVEVSTDGTNYSPLTITQPASNSAWGLVTATGVIPSTGNLRIKFTKAGSSSSYRLDDVKLTTTITTVEIGSTGSLTTCGTPVTLTSNIPSGNSWSLNGSTTRSITISAIGPYTTTVTATGSNGCTLTSAAVSGEIFAIPTLPVAAVNQPTCTTSTGTITISAPAGPGYTYSIDGLDYSNVTGVFSGVASAVYSVTARNSGGCTSPALSVTVNNQPATPSTPTATVTDASCTVATGAVAVLTPLGAGLTYSLDGIDYSNTTGSFPVVSQGTYNLTVRNSDGCTSPALSVTINPQPVIVVNSIAPALGCPGSTVSIFGTDLLNVNSVLFNGTSATFTVMSNNQVDAVVPVGATSGPITVSTAAGCVANSQSFTVTTCATGLVLNLKVFIEGYYTGGGFMDNSGSGGCLFVNGVAGALATDADTVTVSLMNGVTFAQVATQQGILKTNGNLSVTFNSPVTAGSSYFIKLTHRNAIQTWSAAPVTMAATTTYDFTTAATQAFGGNMTESFDQMGWMIYSGDISDANFTTLGLGYQDEIIDSQDYTDMENAVSAIKTGYVPEDVTGDGIVESADYTIMENGVSAIRFSIHP